METIKIIIENRRGLKSIDWKELLEYRDLFSFMVWRNIKVRYAQSVLGVGWALHSATLRYAGFYGYFRQDWPRSTRMGSPMQFSVTPPWCHGPILPMP